MRTEEYQERMAACRRFVVQRMEYQNKNKFGTDLFENPGKDPNAQTFEKFLPIWLNIMPESWIAIVNGTAVDVSHEQLDLTNRVLHDYPGERAFIAQIVPAEEPTDLGLGLELLPRD